MKICRWSLQCLVISLALVMSAAVSAASDSSRDRSRDSAHDSSRRRYLLFVGTYTEHESKGIYAYRFDSESGELSPLGLVAQTANPSFLTLDPNRRFLYAVNELTNYNGSDGGAVTAFALDRQSPSETKSANSHKAANDRGIKLSVLNQVSSRGADPCYIAFDKTGKYLLVANYTGGSVAVFPVQPDGRLGDPTAVVQHKGSSVDPERQKGPHAHWIETTPDNRFAIAADLGLDELLVYRFDAKTGSLTPNDPPYAKLDPGAGPRHVAFNAGGRVVYVLNEMQSTITRFTYDIQSGTLQKKETISTLVKGFNGTNTAAEITVHPNGKFLFASNRGDDSIAVFSVDSTSGALTFLKRVPTGGKEPRHFEIDPSGKFLLAANQVTGSIVVFRIDTKTGTLTHTGEDVDLSEPVCLKFMPED